MKDRSTERIHTDRLYLREITIEDTAAIYNIVKEHEVGKWLAASKGLSYEETEDYVKKLVEHWNQHQFGVWVVVNQLSEEIIGHCGLRFIEDTQDIEIMYLLNKNHWGKGYASEAAQAAIDFSNHTLNVNQLVARVRVMNGKSIKTLTSLGFHFVEERNYNGRVLSFYKKVLV
ncbi:GNAT family N-acetyltransferase [Jeotgalibacillus sp. ET6]|uniref:GNAT family N-acetyltransferase n=1 Tax=Jeotgalibacillus sp. ET6 TaxID=3037260 RepID=UPI0024183243|nr:GNAT family N-acetyltransferase [Jeotgalibacillus sp. ET6]MDG5471384.1 GNAT family N-acetyltransferase [Jeotgalibacillus sp. ET6]